MPMKMGRLFQYNRFGNNTDNHSRKDNSSKKDNFSRNSSKAIEQATMPNCPAYSELYPCHYNGEPDVDNKTTTTTAATATTTTTTTSTTTLKSVELAIKKYQQWSSKFLPTTTPSGAVVTTTTSTEGVSHLSGVSTASAASSCACTASSGYYSKLSEEREGEAPLVSNARRPKVYDCMKDFLRRKLFQQQATGMDEAIKQQSSTPLTMQDGKSETEEDVTSDYDEVDMLDSSYNADEEDVTDCSSNCTYPLESSSEETEDLGFEAKVCDKTALQPNTQSNSPRKSALSLNCWQKVNHTDSSTDEDAHNREHTDDSDAGISDCCQLINEKSPKRRPSPKKSTQKPSPKMRKTRYNYDEADAPELLDASWYQPRITTQAALDYLSPAAPGSFLVRRKAHRFQLCMRAATKVKQFTVVATQEENYKLKGARKQFSSLKALVTHHSVMAEQLPLTLSLPRERQVEKQHVALRYADDFDTFESLQILGILKSLQAKAFEYN